MHYELFRYAETDKLAKEVARLWLESINRDLPKRARIALSGGRIAGRFFKEAAMALVKSPSLFQEIDFFWADERCVPPSHAESNYGLAWENLFKQGTVDSSRLHRIHGEVAPEVAAKKAESEICSLCPIDNAGVPILDLVFLGMGEDGHVASLFPGETEGTMNSSSIFRAVHGPKPPFDRITMGYQVLSVAREVWVLASGSGKRTALLTSLSGSSETPLGHLLQLRSVTRIFTDIPE